ncbi:AAA family ATPase [Candidatus Roizmanbacteria bacterium]|nr:AAA family ATPase [Candidatus Roizmanbacteria bacterium]
MGNSILAITGPSSCGKDVLCAHLNEKYGFSVLTMSDIIRGTAARCGFSTDRTDLRSISRAYREIYGPQVYADQILQEAQEQKIPVVINGVRLRAEVALLQEAGIPVVGVTMPMEKRFELMKNRGRPGDPVTMGEFEKLVAIEESGENHDPYEPNVYQCLQMADVKIVNNGTLQQLYRKVDYLAESLINVGECAGYVYHMEGNRPSFKEI